MLARQLIAMPHSYLFVAFSSFFKRFVVKSTTGVSARKHCAAARYPIRLCEKRVSDMTSTTWNAAHSMSWPIISK